MEHSKFNNKGTLVYIGGCTDRIVVGERCVIDNGFVNVEAYVLEFLPDGMARICDMKERKSMKKEKSTRKKTEKLAKGIPPEARHKVKAVKSGTTSAPKEGNWKPVDKMVDTDVTTKHLKCTLTDQEFEQWANEAAHAWEQKKKLEGELESLKQNHKSQITEWEGRHSRLQREVLEHATYRDIDCSVRKDYRTKTVTTTRLDTNEVIEERPMNMAELSKCQLALPEKSGGKAGTSKTQPEKSDGKEAQDDEEETPDDLEDFDDPILGL